jgi:protein phosphatase
MIKIKFYGKTDTGLIRKRNEDAFILRPDFGFGAVADGMGGEQKGEVASRIFVETALEVFSGCTRISGEEELSRMVQRTFGAANERILAWAGNNKVEKMGCTAELIAFCGSVYVLGHVGDSRTYRLRRGQLRQLTRDHSLVQEQLDQGVVTPAQAQKSRWRNVILRAVGTEDSLAVDLLKGTITPGDLFLLCSDGLTNMVEDAVIQDILTGPLMPESKVDRLIELAKETGGQDNITAVVCEVAN